MPVAEDDIAIQPDAEAVQVQQEEPREAVKQPLDHRVKRVVERRVSDPDPVADLVAGERPLVDGPASGHPGGDDTGPEAAMLLAVRVAVHVGDEPAERGRDRRDTQLRQERIQVPGQPV